MLTLAFPSLAAVDNPLFIPPRTGLVRGWEVETGHGWGGGGRRELASSKLWRPGIFRDTLPWTLDGTPMEALHLRLRSPPEPPQVRHLRHLPSGAAGTASRPHPNVTVHRSIQVRTQSTYRLISACPRPSVSLPLFCFSRVFSSPPGHICCEAVRRRSSSDSAPNH